MAQGLEEGAETGPLPRPRCCRRSPGAGCASLAMAVYAVALAVWSELLGIPNDTVQVFVWLWFGTIAWNIEAPRRYHLRFLRDWSIPMVGLVIYFYSRGLTDELGLPVHITMPIRVDEWLGGGTLPTERLQERCAATRACDESDPRWYDVFFTTVYASHFLTGLTIAAVLWVRNRAEWLLWMRRYVASTSARSSSTSSTRWRRRGWPPRRATSPRGVPDSPAAAGATSAWAAST